MFMLLYGAGLRVSEVLALTTADVDSARMVLHIRDTKCCQARPMRSLGLSSHLLVDVDGGVTSAMALAELPLLSPLAAM
jgi:hypothetical protein